MNVIDGNLIHMAINGDFDVMVHGCNCFGAMGSGIARQVKDTFPEAYSADLATEKGDSSKLGTYSIATYDDALTDYGKLHVVNAYTQYAFWNDADVDYEAIRWCFKDIKEDFGDLRVAYPLIGCGLAGGDWNIVKNIIDEEMGTSTHTLVRYK